jgi:hypothetical protein
MLTIYNANPVPLRPPLRPLVRAGTGGCHALGGVGEPSRNSYCSSAPAPASQTSTSSRSSPPQNVTAPPIPRHPPHFIPLPLISSHLCVYVELGIFVALGARAPRARRLWEMSGVPETVAVSPRHESPRHESARHETPRWRPARALRPHLLSSHLCAHVQLLCLSCVCSCTTSRIPAV